MADEFQSKLGELVLQTKPKIYVETGFMTGESAKAVAEAMDKIWEGEVYSIEPFINPAYKHPRLTVVHGFSYTEMEKLFLSTGAWDLFLHDSNHDTGCMTFELELAFRFTRPGGIIACDDYTWGTPSHMAWQYFVARHNLVPIQLGSAQYAYKPTDCAGPVKTKDWSKEQVNAAMKLSNAASVAYGNKPIFSTPVHSPLKTGDLKPMMKTLCLTLHETPEREAACRKHFMERGVEADFVYGVHAGTCGLQTSNNYEVDNPGSGFNIGKHGVGIWTSFIMMYQICNQLPDEHFFLLEHDAQFDPNWRERFDKALKDVPPDFDFLFIGHCCVASDPTKKHVKGDVWEVKRPYCNHAAIIAKKCLPFVIKTLKLKCWAPLDIQLVAEVFPKLKVYALLPRAVHQFDKVIGD
jgi:hypothetical protein